MGHSLHQIGMNLNKPDPVRHNQPPRVLFSTTNRWCSDTMVPRALRDAGAAVGLLCPVGHPGWSARLEHRSLQSILRPVQALSRAIADFSPDLLIPGDERALRAMHRLHRMGTPSERSLIEASIGSPDSFELVMSRHVSMLAVQAAGLAVPDLIEDTSRATLAAMLERGEGPLVLKADGTWAGQGVRIVRRVAELDAARSALQRVPLSRAVKRWLINRDPVRLLERMAGGERRLSAQSYIAGQIGDMALFCRDGELLASVTAERDVELDQTNALGPSTIVRIVNRPALEEGARRLVARLGLSGFVGLDFIVDPSTDQAYVIEINPRATALAAIRSPYGPSPAAAAARSLGATPSQPPARARDLVAYFPKAWAAHPDDPRLSLCMDDIPSDEPELIECMLQTEWTDRGWRAGLWNATERLLTGTRDRDPSDQGGFATVTTTDLREAIAAGRQSAAPLPSPHASFEHAMPAGDEVSH